MRSGIKSEAKIFFEWHSEKVQAWKKISYIQTTKHLSVNLSSTSHQ